MQSRPGSRLRCEKKHAIKNRFVILRKAPRLKISARFCRGCFEKFDLEHEFARGLCIRTKAIFSRTFRVKIAKGVRDGKTKRSSVLRSLLLLVLFFQKEKVERSLLTRRKRVLVQFFIAKNCQTVFQQPKKWCTRQYTIFIEIKSLFVMFAPRVVSFCQAFSFRKEKAVILQYEPSHRFRYLPRLHHRYRYAFQERMPCLHESAHHRMWFCVRHPAHQR